MTSYLEMIHQWGGTSLDKLLPPHRFAIRYGFISTGK